MHTAIVPRPLLMEMHSGAFVWLPETKIFVGAGDARAGQVAHYLAARVASALSLDPTVERTPPREDQAGCVLLTIEGADAALGAEGYELAVAPDLIVIRAPQAGGLFYGVQSLCQLLPAKVHADNPIEEEATCVVPCMRIEDKPRYAWRGMHLDVCRHFMPLDFLKKFIDLMAVHKYNTFHWHLTEDQGWRIEIERYPKLTQIGAWRTETNGERYGGYYTQGEVREIVEYARARFIAVVPEIEMPGHAVANLAAYPELSCSGGPFEVETTWGVFDDILCAGKEEVFAFLEGVLDEVIPLFPAVFFHIGGDEAPKTRWKECPDCQARIRAEGLADEDELQSYFIKRIERYLNAKGKRLIGWDEILEGGLAPNATVMSWRGVEGGIAAARAGHDVVMTPFRPCYLNVRQNPDQNGPGHDGAISIEEAYAFEPTPLELTPEEATHILGGQANIWTERILTPQDVEFMAFPRACAIAEALWSASDRRDWSDFRERLDCHMRRLGACGVNYCAP